MWKALPSNPIAINVYWHNIQLVQTFYFITKIYHARCPKNVRMNLFKPEEPKLLQQGVQYISSFRPISRPLVPESLEENIRSKIVIGKNKTSKLNIWMKCTKIIFRQCDWIM